METISKINKVEDYYDYACLAPIIDKISDVSMMADYERAFLNSLIRQYKPKKLLELGVAKGGSSVVMLNAIKDIEDAKLYSIDYLDYLYCDNSKKVGYAVKERVPELVNRWELKTNGLPCDFMDEIGGDIDFVLIDTMHINPGEILDFLMVLPYLKENAVVVFHDTALHVISSEPCQFKIANTNNLLMSAIKGKKILPEFFDSHIFPNIGAVELNKSTRENIWDIFNIIKQPWVYAINQEEVGKIVNCFEKQYGTKLTNIFVKAANFYNSDLDSATKILNSVDVKKIIKKVRFALIKYFLFYKFGVGKQRKYYKKLYKETKIKYEQIKHN